MWIIFFTVQLVLWNTALCEPTTCNDEYQFPCKVGGCTAMTWVCDEHNDCGDDSDIDVCGPRCPKFSYECDNGVGCYEYTKYCDGTVNCADGSDEFHCKDCPIGYPKCLAEDCATTMSSLRPARLGACAVPNVHNLFGVMEESLIYANGSDLYSLSLFHDAKRHLHRQESFEIAALTYRAETNTIFWAAGSKIYSLASATIEEEVEVRGEIRQPCLIVYMAYDWITGNFYLACKQSTVLACTSQSGHGPMLCSTVMHVGMETITWLALDPNSGRMFIGGYHGSGSQIVESESDGSNARIIHRGDSDSSFYFDSKLNAILILKAGDHGSLSRIDLLRDTERAISSKILQTSSMAQALALLTNLAIFRKSDGVYGLFLAKNRTLIQVKRLDIEPTARLFHLINPDTQPMGENPCDRLRCDNLCLLAHGGAVCKCGSFYTDDAGPCEVRRLPGFRHTTVAPSSLNPRLDYFAHTIYLVTIVVVSVGCGAVLCYYLKLRRKFYGAQASVNRAEQSVAFVHRSELVNAAPESEMLHLQDPAIEADSVFKIV